MTRRILRMFIIENLSSMFSLSHRVSMNALSDVIIPQASVKTNVDPNQALSSYKAYRDAPGTLEISVTDRLRDPLLNKIDELGDDLESKE